MPAEIQIQCASENTKSCWKMCTNEACLKKFKFNAHLKTQNPVGKCAPAQMFHMQRSLFKNLTIDAMVGPNHFEDSPAGMYIGIFLKII
jgi:hypothetical protein